MRNLVSILFLLLCCTGGKALGQTPVWSQVYQTTNGFGADVVADDEGNAYVTAVCGDRVSHVLPEGVYLAKLDASGTTRWSHHSAGAALALGQNGSLFVVTQNTDDTVDLTKYGRDGQRMWARPLDPPSCENARIATDADGDLYLACSIRAKASPPGDYDVQLSKLNSEGTVLWTRSWRTPYNDLPRSVRIDSAKNVYVGIHFAESVPPAEGNHLQLVKLGPKGDELWSRTLPGQLGSFSVHLIDTDGSSCLIDNLPPSSGSIGVTKFGSDGAKQWARKWSTDGTARGEALALDKEGNLYVAGSAYVRERYSHLFLLKYDRAGALLWAHLEKTTVYDGASAMALDSQGNIFLTGVTYGKLGESLAQGRHAQTFIIKHAPYAPPSFNCLRATSLQEKLICQDARLSSLDASIAAVFKSRVARGGRKRAAAEQQAWLKEKRNTCAEREQLEAVMAARLDELKARR